MEQIIAIISSNLVPALLLVFGFILVSVEIFIPGFGLPGIAGIILLVVGVVLAANSVLDALIILVILAVALGAVIAIALKSARNGKLAKSPLVLSESLDKQSGYSSSRDGAAYVGRQGIALTDLRPAGTCDFDGIRLDVVSENTFIAKGTQVTVIEVEGRRIVVRPLPTDQSV